MVGIASVIAVGLLLAAAAVHAYWATGGVWPAASGRALAQAVVGPTQEKMPSPSACAAVAILLTAAAAIVLARAELVSLPGPEWIVPVGTWVVVGALAARGVIGLVTSLAAGREATYHRLDVLAYSPLCLTIALLCLPAALA